MWRSDVNGWLCAGILFWGLTGMRPLWADEVVPAESRVGTLAAGERLHLVSPLETGSSVRAGGWHMDGCGWRVADRSIGAKLGRDALVFHGTTDAPGKGDFAVSRQVPGRTVALGMWVHIAQDANVSQVGFQIYDRQGEALLHLTPVDWTGWKWVETPVTADDFEQAYPQADQNRVPDMPIGGVHVIWWAKQPGVSEVVVDGVVAKVVEADGSGGNRLSVELLGATDVPRDAAYGGSLLLTNASEQPAQVEIELSLQRDGRLYNIPVPDPVHGSDHALAARSRTVAENGTIAEDTLTDGLDYTAAATAYRSDYWTSADQFVELDVVREVTALGWQAGDANWIWKVDVRASIDGRTFAPVPDLQGIDMHKKWGNQRFPDFAPLKARVIQFHYHRDRQKMSVVRMPAGISVWDGVAGERFALPQAGGELQRITLTESVAAGSFAVAEFEFTSRLATGQYLLASRVSTGDYRVLQTRHVFVEPGWLRGVDETSRFGLNASRSSLAEQHRRLGIGWVRFENFKWPMVSPAPHEYAFDGTTRPWLVDIDQITRDYRDAGLQILPMMFLTPRWASGAGDSIPPGVRLAQPPRDNADFGEFAFQSAARYGSRQIDPSQLKTKDKVSGLDRIGYFELGNEPNLNPLRDPDRPPTWGPWAGTMDRWWEMWRRGAEAVKRADPEARVPSPGFAGMTSELVDQMRVYRYADGKCPLDFVDMISVHFYSGRTPPEIATRDANSARDDEVSFVEHLQRLVEWRDRYKPGAPIWMTETGYDTGGPIGTNESTQAARLPRVVALCLAHGIDKVIVYRESGSAPGQHAAAGVLRDDLSRKPSWYTYATLIRQLHEATPGARLTQPGDNVWLQIWHRGGHTMLMAYGVTGEAELGIELGAATVTDAFGGETRVRSTRDLKLTELPVYITDMSDDAALRPRMVEAERRERARAQQRAAAAQREIYLFNFGDPGHPIATNIGKIRYYHSVPADCMFDADRRYGFVGRPASNNDFKHWVESDIEKYAVKFDKDQVFRYQVRPGTYELRINAKPWGASADLVVEGADGGPIAITFRSGDGETAVRTLHVPGGTLQIKGTYQHLLRWLVLTEVAPG